MLKSSLQGHQGSYVIDCGESINRDVSRVSIIIEFAAVENNQGNI